MNPTRRTLRPDQLWLLLAAAVLLAALVLGGLWVAGVHQRAAERLAQIEPRHARLAGLLQNEEQLAQATQDLQANLANFLHPADADPGQIGNSVLQRVRELAAAQELRVTSSQVTAPAEDRDHPGFERLGLSVRVEGDWAQVQALLAALPRERPAIYSQTVQLQAQGGLRVGRGARGAPPDAAPAPTIQAQLDLYALQERQP